MKCKAKTLEGRWVEGYYVYDDRDKEAWITQTWEDGERNYEIDLSTVCRPVFGTELSEGDELEDRKGNKGFLYYDARLYCWCVNGDIDKTLMAVDCKPTGKNIYD